MAAGSGSGGSCTSAVQLQIAEGLPGHRDSFTVSGWNRRIGTCRCEHTRVLRLEPRATACSGLRNGTGCMPVWGGPSAHTHAASGLLWRHRGSRMRERARSPFAESYIDLYIGSIRTQRPRYGIPRPHAYMAMHGTYRTPAASDACAEARDRDGRTKLPRARYGVATAAAQSRSSDDHK